MSEDNNHSGGRGFASMDPEKQREIARKGGMSQGWQNNPSNFKHDPERARAAGRKGGLSKRNIDNSSGGIEGGNE